MSIKDKLIDFVINQALKQHKDVKITDEQRKQLRDLTSLLANKSITEKQFSEQVNLIFKK